MIFWLFSGFDQKSGALICCSVWASWALRAGASKIAPHSVCLLAERNVFSFQFVEGHAVTSLASACKLATRRSPAYDVRRGPIFDGNVFLVDRL